jgi:hypothetical protein
MATLSAEDRAKLLALDRRATPEPWAWESIAEKSNEFAVGQAFRENAAGEYVAVSGRIDEVDDTIIERRRMVGMNESGHASFADAELIVWLRNNCKRLLAALDEAEERQAYFGRLAEEQHQRDVDALAALTVERDEARGCPHGEDCACAIGSRHLWHEAFCKEREKAQP